MSSVLLFLEECEKFRKWIEDPNLSIDSLEDYANTGILPDPFPPERVVRKQRTDPNTPPNGEFNEGSMWFHPVTQEMFVYSSGAWVSTNGLSTQRVKEVANSFGIHSYYQSLTHQFKFSSKGYTWVADHQDLKNRINEGKDLEDYFKTVKSFIEENSRYNMAS